MTIKRRLAEFERLTPAEEKLRAEIGEGEPVIIGDGERPAVDAGTERQVSAAFLRYLILGGCATLRKPVPENGVRIRGARITGVLDLEGCGIQRDIVLANCRIDVAPMLRSARVETLDLRGSVLPGLVADGVTARGTIILRGAESNDEVRLVGAAVGEKLECQDARMKAKESGRALSADGMVATDSVILNRLIAWGEVRFPGVKLGGNIFCERARLRQRKGDRALLMQTAEITGAFVLRGNARIDGVLDLVAAQLGTIEDEKTSWPALGNLALNRCRYGGFVGASPVDANDRIAWLSLQGQSRGGQEFRPQPWEQCAEVLRRMGHGEDARKILIEKEKRQRRARRARRGRVGRAWFWVLDMLLGLTIRYGREPLVAFRWLAAVGVVGALIFYLASASEAIKPNNSIVLRSPEWAACAENGERRDGSYTLQLACFEAQPEAGGHPTFQAAIYSADTLLPFVDLEMQEFWIPDAGAASSWGWVARGYLWLHIVLGWALSLLAVAGFSGLIKTDSQ